MTPLGIPNVFSRSLSVFFRQVSRRRRCFRWKRQRRWVCWRWRRCHASHADCSGRSRLKTIEAAVASIAWKKKHMNHWKQTHDSACLLKLPKLGLCAYYDTCNTNLSNSKVALLSTQPVLLVTSRTAKNLTTYCFSDSNTWLFHPMLVQSSTYTAYKRRHIRVTPLGIPHVMFCSLSEFFKTSF